MERSINKMINLYNVTCFITEWEEKEKEVLELLQKLKENINFKKIIFLKQSNEYFDDYVENDIDIKYLKKMTIIEYNNFCVQRLNQYIDTDFCMLVQLDGHPINFNLWDDNFLKYDYIGAPWLSNHYWVVHTNNIIGNGGFCIRSKKFLEESAMLDYSFEKYQTNEDVFLCCFAGNYLKSKGITFAPYDVAVKFSIEKIENSNYDITNSFGYHGKEHIEVAKKILNNTL